MKIPRKLQQVIIFPYLVSNLFFGACSKNPIDSGEEGKPSIGDTRSPNTAIISGPTGEITNRNVTFRWSGSDNETPLEDLLYSYYLSNKESGFGQWTKLTQKSYNDLIDGQYAFYVRTKDQAGNIDQTPSISKFSVIPPNDDLEFIRRYVITNNSENIDAITIGKNGNLATINSNGLLRIHDITNPSNVLNSYQTDAKFCSGLAFDENDYWAKMSWTNPDIWVLEGNNPENVILKGLTTNVVDDMYYGIFNNQGVLFLGRDLGSTDEVRIVSTDPSGQYNEFNTIKKIDAPWAGLSGLFGSYSISLVSGDKTKMHRHNVNDMSIEKSWNITGASYDYIRGLAVKENKAYFLGSTLSPSSVFIDVYRFSN